MFDQSLNQFTLELFKAGPIILMGIVVLLGFWIVAIIIEKVIIVVGKKARIQNDISFLLARIARVGLIVIGIISALGTIGVNVSAMVASLGLTGFALGFALKDALSNALAGVLVLIYQPFRLGSRIRTMGFEGEVRKIDLRYTTLQTEDRRILIPNANLFNNPIEIMQE